MLCRANYNAAAVMAHTDYGTGAVAMLFGGNLKGDGVITTVMGEIFGLDAHKVGKNLFPNSNIIKPWQGLYKA